MLKIRNGHEDEFTTRGINGLNKIMTEDGQITLLDIFDRLGYYVDPNEISELANIIITK